MNHSLEILLAEDHDDDAVLLRQAFAKAEVKSRLHVVPDGAEVIEYLRGAGVHDDRVKFPFPHLLLLDVNTPRRNGFEVLEWLRQQPSCHNLMVHVFTSSARAADVTRAYELRANSYVVKPSRMDELTAFAKALGDWHRFVRLAPTPLGRECAPVAKDRTL